MTIESLLKDYAAFNLWANSQFVNWLKTKPLDLITREAPSSFSSIRDTLIHIWGAEEIWLQRMQSMPPAAFLSQRFNGTVEDVFSGILKNSEAFCAYVQSLSDPGFQAVCAFKLLNGTDDQRPRAQMIHHCLNHSTYHRGQIVAMARSFGLADPPSTDYIKYVRLSA